MRAAGPGLVGCAKADSGAAGDQRRARIGLGDGKRRIDCGKIHPVASHDVPAGGIETLCHVFRRGKRRRAIDRDAIVIPQHVEATKLEMPGKADGFLADAFHQATIAGNHPGAVIDQIITIDGIQVAFRHRHADRHRQPLPQWPGGCFDTSELEILGVAGARAAELTEIPDVLDRRPGIAGQVQQRIKQHRAMAGRQDEAIPVRPIGPAGIELQMPGEQRRRGIGHPHRHAGMAGIGRLHSVHCQGPDGIRHVAVIGHW
jgi:hypothetical protein